MAAPREEQPVSCPTCHEPNVFSMSTVDARRHYRCPACMWSWHLAADRGTG